VGFAPQPIPKSGSAFVEEGNAVGRVTQLALIPQQMYEEIYHGKTFVYKIERRALRPPSLHLRRLETVVQLVHLIIDY
jgi:hypothetical protein